MRAYEHSSNEQCVAVATAAAAPLASRYLVYCAVPVTTHCKMYIEIFTVYARRCVLYARYLGMLLFVGQIICLANLLMANLLTFSALSRRHALANTNDEQAVCLEKPCQRPWKLQHDEQNSIPLEHAKNTIDSNNTFYAPFSTKLRAQFVQV